MTLEHWRITSQPDLDSYLVGHVRLAAILVNTLAATHAHGRAASLPTTGEQRLSAIQAALREADESPRTLTAADADALTKVATQIRAAFEDGDDIHAAATLNRLLARHRAVPNLHGEPGDRLHLAFHHPNASNVDAWAADMCAALAIIVGIGQSQRLKTCHAEGCALVFFDVTRSAQRRYCDLSCQNRSKAAAYRSRKAGGST